MDRLRPRRAELRAAATARPARRSFAAALRAGETVAVIGEYKRRSPSAGPIGTGAGPAETARAYAAAGVAAMSVLTDREYFGGSLEDLRAARAATGLPVMRKDFTVNELQVWEAAGAGADAILLIVRILDDAEMRDLLAAARDAELDTLVEVHDRAELERALAAGADVIGVNSRDLATFTTDPRLSLELARHVPPERILVAESGIHDAAAVAELGAAGVDAILVGEALMRAGPGGAAQLGLAGVPRRERGR